MSCLELPRLVEVNDDVDADNVASSIIHTNAFQFFFFHSINIWISKKLQFIMMFFLLQYPFAISVLFDSSNWYRKLKSELHFKSVTKYELVAKEVQSKRFSRPKASEGKTWNDPKPKMCCVYFADVWWHKPQQHLNRHCSGWGTTRNTPSLWSIHVY